MKVLITSDIQKASGDYVTFCPFVNEETDSLKTIDVNSLSIDAHIDNGELEELLIDNILDSVPITKVLDVINKLIKKLRHGGTIIINGVDAYLVAKAFVEIRMSIEQFNVLLHGTDQDLQKTVNLTCQGVANFLSDAGLKIVHRRIDVYQYSVKATRP